ncbi:MAG: flagellar biosynthetic protein FliQ [Planctomycetaceae bacterium]
MTEWCDLVRHALWTLLLVAAPLLAAGVVVAVVVGIAQAATGIQEPLLALAPRLLAMAAVLLVGLPWMAERLVELLVHSVLPPP